MRAPLRSAPGRSAVPALIGALAPQRPPLHRAPLHAPLPAARSLAGLLALSAVLALGVGFAQASPALAPAGSAPASLQAGPAGPPPALHARSFTIRYRNAGDVALLVQPILSLAGSYTLQPALHTITVQDTEEVLARVTDVIRSFDVPPRNIEVTINLLLGTHSQPGQQPLSKEVRGITDVLPDITKWTNYKLIDSVSITGSEGAVMTRTLGGGQGGDAYQIEMGIQSVDDEHGVIRIEPFIVRKEVRVDPQPPVWKQEYASKLNLRPKTLLTVVAAKSEKSEKALFLTIRARVMD